LVLAHWADPTLGKEARARFQTAHAKRRDGIVVLEICKRQLESAAPI
jgi:hypothetical protein